MKKISLIAIMSLGLMTGCASTGSTVADGALVGAGTGAIAGQLIGGNTGSTLVGAAIGAGVGGIVGNEKQKQGKQLFD